MRFTLSNASVEAAVQTEGGELVSLRDLSGTEYIWQGDPAFWSGQNPILFPIVGSLKGGRVDIGGKTFEMARHGFARRCAFTAVDQGRDFLVLELRESPETLARYPFPFVLRVRHQLLDNGFSTAFTVENPSQTSLPFCIGAHTAIRCPLLGGETFEDYELVFDCPEDADTLLRTSQGLLRDGSESMLRGVTVRKQPARLPYNFLHGFRLYFIHNRLHDILLRFLYYSLVRFAITVLWAFCISDFTSSGASCGKFR